MYAKNTWEKYKDNLNEVMEYNEGYKDYISKNKTERACVKDSIRLAKEKGFKPLDSFETLNSSLLTKNIIIKTINPNIESEIVIIAFFLESIKSIHSSNFSLRFINFVPFLSLIIYLIQTFIKL